MINFTSPNNPPVWVSCDDEWCMSENERKFSSNFQLFEMFYKTLSLNHAVEISKYVPQCIIDNWYDRFCSFSYSKSSIITFSCRTNTHQNSKLENQSWKFQQHCEWERVHSSKENYISNIFPGDIVFIFSLFSVLFVSSIFGCIFFCCQKSWGGKRNEKKNRESK